MSKITPFIWYDSQSARCPTRPGDIRRAEAVRPREGSLPVRQAGVDLGDEALLDGDGVVEIRHQGVDDLLPAVRLRAPRSTG